MNIKKLETKRLILRKWKLEEAKELARLAEDKKLIFGDMPHPYSEKDAENWLKTVYKKKDKHYYAIEEKQSKRIIGICWLTITPEKNGLIVYGIEARSRGSGYATEATRELVKYGLTELKLPKIVAETKAENMQSHNVLTKLRFKVIRKQDNHQKNRFTGEMEGKWWWEKVEWRDP